jgi:multidrug efflux pump subunit AcrA (membrane-fusion protein)
VRALSPNLVDGGAVAADEVLVRIDPVSAEATRDLAAADLAEAEAERREALVAVDLARDDLAAAEAQAALQAQALTRQRDLQARGVGSPAAVEAAELALSSSGQAVLSRRSALAAAEAAAERAGTAVTRARIALDQADRALADTVLRAPFAGVLAGVSVIPGRLLTPNERIGDLIDPQALEVVFRLSAAELARLGEAAAVRVIAPAGGEVAGRVSRLAAAVGEGQTGRDVFAALDTPGGLRPGDFVEVRVAEPTLPAVVVLPATAVGSDGMVLALGDGDRLEAVAVTLLRRQGNLVLLAPDGIAGREVVQDRAPTLGEGIRVRPVRPGEEPKAEMIDLTPERRAALIAQVEANTRMPEEAKARILAQLAEDKVPARVVARLEGRGG